MLGWKGKGTQFDFLPMLLNGSDGEPHYYELPDRLCMEVKIRHPTIEAITNLNLKWFGLPGKTVMVVGRRMCLEQVSIGHAKRLG